jgi:hypothetical protein
VFRPQIFEKVSILNNPSIPTYSGLSIGIIQTCQKADAVLAVFLTLYFTTNGAKLRRQGDQIDIAPCNIWFCLDKQRSNIGACNQRNSNRCPVKKAIPIEIRKERKAPISAFNRCHNTASAKLPLRYAK